MTRLASIIRGLSLREALKTVSIPLLSLAAFLALWKLAVAEGWISDLILPPPEEVASNFVDLLGGDLLWPHVRVTGLETLAGFCVGAGLAIVLAAAAALSDSMRRMLYPYAITLQVTPTIAIAPIMIAWLGFGYSPKIALAAIIVFFPVFVNAFTGMVTVDQNGVDLFRSLGASRIQTFLHLQLPSGLPVLFAGLKTGVALALSGALVGEFVAADEGLGVLIQRFTFQVNMADALAVLVVLIIMGLALFAAMTYIARLVVFWLHDDRMNARTRRRMKRDEKRRAKRGAVRTDAQRAGDLQVRSAGADSDYGPRSSR